jgi:hypothetical protein
MDNPLIGPASLLGYPAPYWFLLFFKVLGFTLHMVPMNLWYAGLLTMLLVRWRGGDHARRLSDRVLNAMPVIIALGVNFGIVPLLFTQVAYHQVFYPSTILMAWSWFAIIPALTVAYYGVYAYVVGLRRDKLNRAGRLLGWAASLIFIAIGFMFANNFSLMTRTDAWATLWSSTNLAGAPLGIALNTSDPALWPRWLMMFGLALTTTGAYVAFDSVFLARSESAEYRTWAGRFAFGLYTLGMVWFAICGSWYFFGGLSPEVRAELLQFPNLILTALTALAPGLPWLLLMIGRSGMRAGLAGFLAVSQFGVLGFNAISRQLVQNIELAPVLDLQGQPVNLQLSPLVLFLLLFLGGVALVIWMIAQAARAWRTSPAG